MMIASILRLAVRYRDLNWAFVDQGMVSGVNFLTGILIARYLGIAEFGRFSLVWLVVLFINSIQIALVVSPMNSIGPKQEADAELAYYGAVLIQQVVISLVAAFLIFFAIRISVEFFPQWQVQSLALPLACVIFTYQIRCRIFCAAIAFAVTGEGWPLPTMPSVI
jgi:O-antigen/teichoic acid export membrane protein